ncbi:MAG TPA: hypothetical protein VNH18_12035 [Bryobacteraceae bacterium]|nr:hypothetical protein [Bryobacteraceae bacterium]
MTITSTTTATVSIRKTVPGWGGGFAAFTGDSTAGRRTEGAAARMVAGSSLRGLALSCAGSTLPASLWSENWKTARELKPVRSKYHCVFPSIPSERRVWRKRIGHTAPDPAPAQVGVARVEVERFETQAE